MLSVKLRKSIVTAQKLLHLARPTPKCWPLALIKVPDGGSDLQHVSRPSFARPPTEWPRDSWDKYCPGVSASVRTGLFSSTQFHALVFIARNQYFHTSVVRLKKRQQTEPPPRELDLLRYDMKDFWKSPKPALWLGFAGLIPFVAPPLFMGVTESYLPEFAYTQLAYSVSIVSFLGGARWGYALPESSPAKPDWINLSNSVVPSLLAWVTMLMADSIVPAVTMVIMALGISLHYDLSLLPTYPSWFKALRAVLTIVAFFSLVGTLVAYGMYPEKNFFSE
ncbi:transmembrane protein 69-like [Hippocampus zosterae]|uniref:transmembrane protein 69-like n=1 Tax=Hippocampus zosterae TaxID=109293 RepID=UPI00223E0609|nr:transmembrane protein 69-like [Hippocampus zosterae]